MKLSKTYWPRLKRHKNSPTFYKEGKIYIVPNWFGLSLLGITIIVIFVGAIYANNLVNLLGYILISFFIIAMIITHFNIRKININYFHINSFFAQSQIFGFIQLKTEDNIKYQINVNVVSTEEYDIPKIFIEEINASSRSHLFHVLASKRGKYNINRIRISSTYPFGLFYTWVDYLLDFEFYAYPVPKSTLFGVESSGYNLETDFSHLEIYKPGDPIRRIDWKSHARGRPLQSKKFTAESQYTYVVDWNKNNFLDFEAKLSQFSFWLQEAHLKNAHFILKNFKSQNINIYNSQQYHSLLKEFSVLQESHE